MAVDKTLALVGAGLLQGVLEWLPVSSSGQVDLLLSLAGYSSVELYALYLHLGTGLAALIRYWRLVIRGLRRPWTIEFQALLVPLLAGAPIALLLLKTVNLAVADLDLAIGVLLVVSGIVLTYNPPAAARRRALHLLDLVAVGVLQGIAVLPGLSRSAIVTAYLLYAIRDPVNAVVYSFYTGITAQLAAGLYAAQRIGLPSPQLILALIASFAAGYAAIRFVEGLASIVRRKLSLFLIVYGLLVVALNITARLVG